MSIMPIKRERNSKLETADYGGWIVTIKSKKGSAVVERQANITVLGQKCYGVFKAVMCTYNCEEPRRCKHSAKMYREFAAHRLTPTPTSKPLPAPLPRPSSSNTEPLSPNWEIEDAARKLLALSENRQNKRT